jgi:hypothetical protein
MVKMSLEPRYKTIFKELKTQNKVTYAKIEDKNYYDKMKKVKDNYQSDLKRSGIIRRVLIEEYPHKIS